MEYDIIFIMGEVYFDHPLCGIAILKRLLEKYGYKVGIIEKPTKEEEIKKLGQPKLFFGITSGAIDSMVRNYTPLRKNVVKMNILIIRNMYQIEQQPYTVTGSEKISKNLQSLLAGLKLR